MKPAEEKDSIRKEALGARAALSRGEAESASREIARRVLELEAIQTADAVLTYISMGKEVDTHGLIDFWLRQNRRVYVPSILGGAQLTWSILDSLKNVGTGARGVPQPVESGHEISAPPADAPVLVPGLAFTRAGARLGRGAGYFDRFLEGHRGPRIGLAFEVQMVVRLPEEKHDQRMDLIVTESALYKNTP